MPRAGVPFGVVVGCSTVGRGPMLLQTFVFPNRVVAWAVEKQSPLRDEAALDRQDC